MPGLLLPELPRLLPGGIFRVMSALAHPFLSIPFSTTVEVCGEMSLSLVLILALIAEL